MMGKQTEIFIARVIIQIRDRRGSKIVRKELLEHLEDSIDEKVAAGLSFEAAELCAIEGMGNPVEIGKSFDKLYNPWRRRATVVICGLIAFHVLFGIYPYVSRLVKENTTGEESFQMKMISDRAFPFGVIEDRYFTDVSFVVGNSKFVLERAILFESDVVYLVARQFRYDHLNAYGVSVSERISIDINDQLISFSPFVPQRLGESLAIGVSPYSIGIITNINHIPDSIDIDYDSGIHLETFTLDLGGYTYDN